MPRTCNWEQKNHQSCPDAEKDESYYGYLQLHHYVLLHDDDGLYHDDGAKFLYGLSGHDGAAPHCGRTPQHMLQPARTI